MSLIAFVASLLMQSRAVQPVEPLPVAPLPCAVVFQSLYAEGAKCQQARQWAACHARVRREWEEAIEGCLP